MILMTDKDGYTEIPGDCDDLDDHDSSRATEEICDGADNDCDNAIDEGFDRDEDGWTTCSGDCNDSDPDVNPGAAEECYDEGDNNGNGIHR